ncbi:MAG: CBS domain-containing protein [Anaerolineae bacterium]|nr:CBS domain-containing protein [Anaerolineae bacterium]
MLYLSQVQGRKVWDAWSRPVGRCADILVGNLEQPFPPVVALALKDHGAPAQFISAEQVSELFPSIVLKVPKENIRPYTPRGDELPLAGRVLDRQIVDTEGRRVVRVNDLQIMRVEDRFCLSGVDVGGRGLLRRLGVERPVHALVRRLHRRLPESIIPWEDVAPLQHEDPLRLRISREKISKLPAADIAAILNDLDRRTSHALLAQFDDETLADALEESPPEVQAAMLSHLTPERAADVLEEMGPDEAADLLADLPAEASARLLELMEDEDAEDVQALLGYPEDSAGGIMTTEFAWVPTGLRAAEALEYLRNSPDAQDDEVMPYVYILDGERRLRGVVSLRDLVMAPPDQPLAQRADESPLTVAPLTSQEDVAYLMAKYDLLAVPVVDSQTNEMLGIVTVDDAIDTVLPTAWKKRLPRLYGG